jgi:hypothetical protein
MATEIEKLEIEIALLQRITTEPRFVISGAGFVRLPELQSLKYELERQVFQQRKLDLGRVINSMVDAANQIKAGISHASITEALEQLNYFNVDRLKLLSEFDT